MNLFHLYHRSKLYRAIHSDFGQFELSVWLNMFSRSMIAIFIPIFLLELNYELKELFVFYLIFNIFDVPLNFLSRYLIQKIGAKKVIILSSISYIAFYICLYNLGVDNWVILILIALFGAIYDAFYYVSYFFLFMRCSHHDQNVSKDTSLSYIVIRLAGIMAPAAGALILIFMNKQVLIVISVIILSLSVIPLFNIKNLDDKPKRRQLKFKEFFNKKRDSKDYVTNLFYTFHLSSENIVWPIFIYLTFRSIQSVAVLPIIVSITTIIVTYFLGTVKKRKRSNMIVLGALLLAIVWILRLYIENDIFYYASVFMAGLFSVFMGIPLDSNLYEKGEKKNTLTASTYINTSYMASNTVYFTILVLFFTGFKLTFVMPIIGLLAVMVINIKFKRKYFSKPKKFANAQ